MLRSRPLRYAQRACARARAPLCASRPVSLRVADFACMCPCVCARAVALLQGYCICYNNYVTSNGYGAPGTRGDCGAARTVITSCPGEIACSGHGVCSGPPQYKCACAAGWTGGDCSERSCPLGHAWFDAATNHDTAHGLAECSRMGLCDRVSGQCMCRPGFEGSACERSACLSPARARTVPRPAHPRTRAPLALARRPPPCAVSCPFGQDAPCTGHGMCLSMSALARMATDNGMLMTYTCVAPRRRVSRPRD